MLDEILKEKIAKIENDKLLRKLKVSDYQHSVNVKRDGKQLISFCDNDYLGLANNEQVVEASISGAWGYGAGAKASRLLTGNHGLYDKLEKLLCEIKNTQAACVFGSGYLANIGAITALVEKGDLVIADRLVHSCILDGISLSGAKLKRFQHNDVDSAKRILQKERANHNNCLIITETVFSMDGDIAPLSELRELADAFDCWLMSDDAHGLAIVKPQAQADIEMGTLSKAVGSYGGYVCGSQTLIDYLVTSSKSLIYSTALPPSVIAASIESLGIIKDSNLGDEVLKKARLFTSLLGLSDAQSAIVPIIIGSDEDCLAASSKLEEYGFLVSAIRQPTVPAGTARLRVTFSTAHKDLDIKRLAEVIKELGLVTENNNLMVG